MKTIFHASSSRGHADHGWLSSYHSFSFAGYFDPEKMGFGMLRVLNDDHLAPGMGFGTHPHDNMEIVSIPLSGSLKHRDDMGNSSVIQSDEVQIMSAGTGVKHSEFNSSREKEVNFLQLWIIPDQRDITPRYEQKYFDPAECLNKWQLVVSPKSKGAIWINQDAYISRATLEEKQQLSYELHSKTNGIYLFLLEGSAELSNTQLNKRDAMGVWGFDQVAIKASKNSELILVEVPMGTA